MPWARSFSELFLVHRKASSSVAPRSPGSPAGWERVGVSWAGTTAAGGEMGRTLRCAGPGRVGKEGAGRSFSSQTSRKTLESGADVFIARSFRGRHGAFSSSSLLAGCSGRCDAPSLLMMSSVRRSTSVGLATSVSEWTAGGCPGILLHPPAPLPCPFYWSGKPELGPMRPGPDAERWRGDEDWGGRVPAGWAVRPQFVPRGPRNRAVRATTHGRGPG